MGHRGDRVLVTLRQMIIKGDFAAGERLTELAIAERLNVSRTPVRAAFQALEMEGLLGKTGNRGYVVKGIEPGQIKNAIEVRGTLEGLAARLLAENGMTRSVRATLLDCLNFGDSTLEDGINEQSLEAYAQMNTVFHGTIVDACGNPIIRETLNRNEHLPFANASALLIDQSTPATEQDRFRFAHMQHHIIFDALDNREGWRAGATMEEHANAVFRYVEIFGRAPLKTMNFRVIAAAE